MEKEIPESQSPFASEPIGRLIVKFAVPSVIALLVNSLYNIADQIFIGWGVGYLDNGATNIVFPITIIALALSMMIGNGGASYLSLKLGEGKCGYTGNCRKYHTGRSFHRIHKSYTYPLWGYGRTSSLCIGLRIYHRHRSALYDDIRLHKLHDTCRWQP